MSRIICFALLAIAMSSFQTEQTITYLPLGDSYTIGTGAGEKESWPYILTEHLKREKVKVELLTNPARNGFSTQNLIDYELPLVKKLKPKFVTLLIGVNDWVRNVPKDIYQKNLAYILDEVQKQLNGKGKILAITIPDFGVTPEGRNYSGGRDISKGISEFNDVIRSECGKRKIAVVDIFGISKLMKEEPSLVAGDGLHPSGKEYAEWEKLIFPEAKKLLGF